MICQIILRKNFRGKILKVCEEPEFEEDEPKPIDANALQFELEYNKIIFSYYLFGQLDDYKARNIGIRKLKEPKRIYKINNRYYLINCSYIPVYIDIDDHVVYNGIQSKSEFYKKMQSYIYEEEANDFDSLQEIVRIKLRKKMLKLAETICDCEITNPKILDKLRHVSVIDCGFFKDITVDRLDKDDYEDYENDYDLLSIILRMDSSTKLKKMDADRRIENEFFNTTLKDLAERYTRSILPVAALDGYSKHAMNVLQKVMDEISISGGKFKRKIKKSKKLKKLKKSRKRLVGSQKKNKHNRSKKCIKAR